MAEEQRKRFLAGRPLIEKREIDPPKTGLRLRAAMDSGFFHFAGILQQECGLTANSVVKILQNWAQNKVVTAWGVLFGQ